MSLLLISGALLFNSPGQTQVINVKFPNGTLLKSEVADTPEKLLFGLAFRPSLPEGEAMLYIFGESGPHRVWTKEFQFPVDGGSVESCDKTSGGFQFRSVHP